MNNSFALRVFAGSLLALAGAVACSNSSNGNGSNQTPAANGSGAAPAGDNSGGKEPAVQGASGNTSADLKTKANHDMSGKTVAYLPCAMGISLTESWWQEIQAGAEMSGIKAIIRDSNWSTQASTQAMSALIAEKPAAMIVHNFNTQLLAKQLEQAEKSGIYVVQVNMVSNYKTDIYVGVDWVQLGQDMAKDIVKACGTGSGKSGKVAILQGELTSATSLDQVKGMMPIFDADKSIKVVSNQATMWDATKAHDITATVLQQNKDLCAIYGFWDTMTMGAVQAVKEAGLTSSVNVLASGDGSRTYCDAVRDGGFYHYYNYDAKGQGRDLINSAKFLMQSGQKPGAFRMAIYSPYTVVTKENVGPSSCFDFIPPKK